MQAAASRPASSQRLRRADRLNAIPQVAAADAVGLLDALPIAAAIIERTGAGCHRISAHNSRFEDAVNKSDCKALDWNEAECLKTGPIAELLDRFFDGTDPSGELDFKQGEGVSSIFFRLKLAPLPKTEDGHERCAQCRIGEERAHDVRNLEGDREGAEGAGRREVAGGHDLADQASDPRETGQDREDRGVARRGAARG